MASRARGYRQDWEQEDFNETYDAQYPDDKAHGGVQLDHCKLYITNINRALNEEGLVTAFSKYGTLIKVYVSRDPIKRYALITFETPGEAKLAMMKLNKTEPLKLNIHIAHKKNNQDQKEDSRRFKQRESTLSHTYTNSCRDDASISSKGKRKQDDFTNGENIDIEETLCDEDLGLDTDLELEMTQLKMKQLQLQQAQLQCKQQMLLLNRGGKKTIQKPSRCILPDGRIVVRNNSEKSDQPDNTYSSAAGDSLTLPSLQRVSSRACLTCGSVGDFYCGGCGLAQYCSQSCQQTDWNARHKFVCHNLACLNGSKLMPKEQPVEVVETVASPPSALRQPNLPQNKDNRQDDNKPKKNLSTNKFRRANPNLKNKTFRHPMRQEKEKNDTDSFNNIAPGPKSIQNEEQGAEKPSENNPQTKMETSSNIKTDIPKGHHLPLKPPASVLDTTPKSKALVPKNYIIETLSLGDTVLLSVDALASDCRSDSGYICLALHETNEADYRLLCGEFGEECEKEKEIDPRAGEAYALWVCEEEAWYRARRASRSHAVLLDCARVVDLDASARSVALPARYEAVAEFCCRLRADVQLNDNLKCTLVSKTSDGYKVSLENAETGASVGEGEVSRWKPTIEYEVSKPVVNVSIPEVPRPPLIDNSRVVIVDATAADKVYVRSATPADTKTFATVLQDGILVGIKGEPVSEPPRSGSTVVARHTDGNCYRALCTRTNVKQNKYLLEYIEYGNTDISTKEKIYPCPQDLDLSNRPTTVSLIKLNIGMALNKNGLEYLERLRDDDVELVLHTTDKSKSAPSGSSVELTVLQSKESVINKLKNLCSPEWKKIEEKGGDVVDCEPLMYSALQYHPLPTTKCTLTVLDISTLRGGALGVCDASLPHHALLADITQQIEAYVKSDLGKEPYLPRIEELCIAQCPPYTQYYRAVLCDHAPGSTDATVCFVDYNNVETVSVATIRRMMPEFATTPALACYAEIQGFPENPSDEQLARAVRHMNIDDEGRGQLSVERCEAVDPGFYKLHAPGLLAALHLQH